MKTASDLLWTNVKRGMLRMQERSLIIPIIQQGTGFDRFAALREFYANANFEIMSARIGEWGIDPYEVDWLRVFTPIEFALWQDIRHEGLVMYPQYPVAGFFLDFANPKAMVAIECDGAAYHLDKAKDFARDAKLKSLGWTIYRITGTECKSVSNEESGEHGAARSLIRDIAARHNISCEHST
jgi:hypothetical protein